MTRITHTHTLAALELSPGAYDEIRGKLEEAGYQHAFLEDGLIGLHGIGVTRGEETPRRRVSHVAVIVRVADGALSADMNKRLLAANELDGHFLRIIDRDGLDHAGAALMVSRVAASHAALLFHEVSEERLSVSQPVATQDDGAEQQLVYGDGLQATVTGGMRITSRTLAVEGASSATSSAPAVCVNCGGGYEGRPCTCTPNLVCPRCSRRISDVGGGMSAYRIGGVVYCSGVCALAQPEVNDG
jgi:hypothetical protein